MWGQRVNNRDKGVTGLVSASLTNVCRAARGLRAWVAESKTAPKEPLCIGISEQAYSSSSKIPGARFRLCPKFC